MSSPDIVQVPPPTPTVVDPPVVTTPPPPVETTPPPPVITTPPPPVITTPPPVIDPTTQPHVPPTEEPPHPTTTSSRPSKDSKTTSKPSSSRGGGGGGGSYPTPSSGAGGGGGGGGSNNGNGAGITDGQSDPESKSVVGPVVGGIAGVLVLGFLVSVFVMRWRKKSRARKRRLDILLDPSGQGQDQVSSALGASGAAGAGASEARPTSIQSSPARPSIAGNGQMEMTGVAVGGASMAHHYGQQQHQQQQQQQQQYDGYDGYDGYGNYDYQQGYPHVVPYGGYQEQYDQHDPYYNPEQQQQQYQYQYQQQQQQHLAGPSAVSPPLTHPSASPKAYPPPPASHSAGSPQTSPQAATTMAYDRHNKIEKGDYMNTQSPARNPQVVTEDGVKVPQ
ncbi:hypothetical protein BGZ94_004335 [Podila epigama]|nr:hypothetical protein BGZ94_004335 [Podila epigama]